ncbi:hypothetical protein ABHI18_005096 [Aspergillus niger]
MEYVDIRTFLNHYLPRLIGTGMQTLMRGLEPDSVMMQAVTRMGRWIDRRRLRELTDAQKATVEQDPELRKAIQKQDAFSRRLQHHENAESLLYALRQRVREESDKEQAVLDIERELAGTSLPNEESKEQIQAIEHLLPQQTSLIGKLMTWPTSLSVEDEWRRRNEATEAVRLDCDVLEGGPRRGRRPKRTIPVERTIRIDDSPAKAVVVQAPVPSLSTSPSPHEATLRAAAEDIRIADTPRTCFQRYGDQAESDKPACQAIRPPQGSDTTFPERTVD